MIQKTTLSLFRVILFFSIFFITKTGINAQTIVPQPLDGLDQLCAGTSFNEFNATFSYVDFPAGTTFDVELSDNLGSFTGTTTIATKIQVNDVSATKQTIRFALPTTLKGSEIYGIRIKSSTGTVSARFRNSITNATNFPAYYKVYETSFSVNGKSGNSTICAGGNITISIDDDESSPLKFPNLKYRWYKDNVLIAGQSGTTLNVNAVGEYYALVDYGACSDINISSNRVNVISSSSGSAVVISSSLGNPFCSNGTGTVLTATQGNTYKWYKDNNLITTATTRSITASESGIYKVEVDFGGCNAAGSIDLKSNGFNASIDVADQFELPEGETVSASITTDAATPTFEWYLNNNLITGATTGNYVVAAVGTYKVKISQASGCVASKEFTFKATGPKGPASVIPNIIKLSGSNPYWNIPDEYKNASTKVMIISANGDMVLDVVDYQGDWPQTAIDFKNVNPVYYYVIQSDTGEKKGSITVIK